MRLELIKPIKTDTPVIVSLIKDGDSIYILAGKDIIALISPKGVLKRVKIKHVSQMRSLGFTIEADDYIAITDTEIDFSTQG